MKWPTYISFSINFKWESFEFIPHIWHDSFEFAIRWLCFDFVIGRDINDLDDLSEVKELYKGYISLTEDYFNEIKDKGR